MKLVFISTSANNISREGGITIKTYSLQYIPFLLVITMMLLIIPELYFFPTGQTTFSDYLPLNTLIIDAGHGGEDGGAVSLSGYKESIINLDIAKRAENLAILFGLNVVMTRESEHIDYPPEASTTRARKRADQEARINLINSYPNAIMISVHQNYYPSRSPHGAQVLYAGTDGSDEFAKIIHDLFLSKLDSSNKRTAEQISDSIYLLKKIECPAVLVECGFLSNPDDEMKLTDMTYQLKLAAIMINSVLTYMNTNGSI